MFKNAAIISIFLAILTVMVGCDAMDTFLSSAGTYKINVRVEGVSLNECSFIASNDRITPFFEESVSKDPDITSLIIFLKNNNGDVLEFSDQFDLYQSDLYQFDPNQFDLNQFDSNQFDLNEPLGDDDEDIIEAESSQTNADSFDPAFTLRDWKVIYSLKSETEYYSAARSVETMDTNLPFFQIPDELPMGFYSMVFQLMSGKNVLQRTEKEFFYLSDNVFSYSGIDVHFPGVTENNQLVSKGVVVMLEAKLDYDKSLDPYIVWYNGKRKIAEGFVSEGAEQLFWKAPEQSSFFSLYAEVFPVEDFTKLTSLQRQSVKGFKKEASILVASNMADIHLVSENIPELVHWYVLENNLYDSKTLLNSGEKNLNQHSLRPVGNTVPKWMASNGTYGFVTGSNHAYTLPKITHSGNPADTWQMLLRFKPLDEGGIMYVDFGANVGMDLKLEDENLVLTLVSPLEKISKEYYLPAWLPAGFSSKDSFIVVGISFSAQPSLVSAKVNLIGDIVEQDELAQSISLDVKIGKEFLIVLGSKPVVMQRQQQQLQQHLQLTEDVVLQTILQTVLQTEQDDLDTFIEEDDTDDFFEMQSDVSAELPTAELPPIVLPSVVMPQFQYEEVERLTVLWDEIALYNNPSMDIIAAEVKVTAVEEQQE